MGLRTRTGRAVCIRFCALPLGTESLLPAKRATTHKRLRTRPTVMHNTMRVHSPDPAPAFGCLVRAPPRLPRARPATPAPICTMKSRPVHVLSVERRESHPQPCKLCAGIHVQEDLIAYPLLVTVALVAQQAGGGVDLAGSQNHLGAHANIDLTSQPPDAEAGRESGRLPSPRVLRPGSSARGRPRPRPLTPGHLPLRGCEPC